MAWFILSQIFSTLLTLFRLGRTSEADKELEILILRQQLGILKRHLDKPIKRDIRSGLSRSKKMNSVV